MVDAIRLLKKISAMSYKELLEERELWTSSTAYWEEQKAYAREKGLKGLEELCAKAIADNLATTKFIEVALIKFIYELD